MEEVLFSVFTFYKANNPIDYYQKESPKINCVKFKTVTRDISLRFHTKQLSSFLKN